MELYLFRDERQTGPYNETDALRLVLSGSIARHCLAWQEGMSEWLPLDQVIDLGAAPVPAATPVGVPPVPSGSRAKVTTAAAPKSKQPAAKPPEPWWYSFLNAYGFGLFISIVTLLRVLATCHHR